MLEIIVVVLYILGFFLTMYFHFQVNGSDGFWFGVLLAALWPLASLTFWVSHIADTWYYSRRKD